MLERLPAGHAHQRDTGGPPGKLSEAARLWAWGLFETAEELDAAREAQERRARLLAQAGVYEADDAGAPTAPRQRPVQTYWLWPRCERAWGLWLELQTQWRTGMFGATGLDYAAVWALIDRRVPRRQRDEMFAALQAMELAALAVWAERRADATND